MFKVNKTNNIVLKHQNNMSNLFKVNNHGIRTTLDNVMVGLSYCLDGIKCCYWRTKYQKVDRTFRDVIRKIVKHLKKSLKSIHDKVHISKDEVYEVKFWIKAISVMELKQLLIVKVNQTYLIVWRCIGNLYRLVDFLGMNDSLCSIKFGF